MSGERAPPGPALAWALVGGASGVIGLGGFYRALSQGAMGLVAPLSALIGAGLPALVGVLLGEDLLPAHVAGIACALVAVALTSRPVATTAGDARQLPLVFVAGLGFAGFFLAMDEASRLGGQTWSLMIAARLAGLGLVVIALIATASRPVPPRRSVLPLFLVAGVGDLGGNAFFLLANEHGQLSIAAVLSSLYPVMTVGLAWLFLRERLGRSHVVGVALALAGVALIAAARPSG